MHGIETELEQAPEAPTERRPEAVELVTPQTERQTFSPDPMQETDRYRLVTPYQLFPG